MSVWLGKSGNPIPKSQSFGLMGIVNTTPDSFYECSPDPALAVIAAGRALYEGADLIDIGAESTRPGALPVSPPQEIERLRPVLSGMAMAFPNATISLDTRNSETAVFGLNAGCEVINDVSACRHDPGLLDVIAYYQPGYVLMHAQGEPPDMQKRPFYRDVVTEVKNFFERQLNRLVRAGLQENRIALDPGIGFGKTLAHNLQLLSHIEEFLQFGRPLLLGVSMKGSLGKLLGLALAERGEATAVCSALAYAKGVIWHRVHEVGRVRKALLLAQALQP